MKSSYHFIFADGEVTREAVFLTITADARDAKDVQWLTMLAEFDHRFYFERVSEHSDAFLARLLATLYPDACFPLMEKWRPSVPISEVRRLITCNADNVVNLSIRLQNYEKEHTPVSAFSRSHRQEAAVRHIPFGRHLRQISNRK